MYSKRYPMKYKGHYINWHWERAGDGVERRRYAIYARRIGSDLWDEVGTAHTLKAAKDMISDDWSRLLAGGGA